VYFPRGCWESRATDQVVRGPRTLRVSAPINRLPYWFRCGTSPFAQAAGKGGCLARRAPIGPRNVGRIRTGKTRRQLRSGRLPRVQPIRRTRHSYRWCVQRSSGRVIAVFGGRGKRSQVVVTTARAHGNRRVRPGGRGRSVRRAYPRRKRIGYGLYRATPGSPRIIGFSRGRVRYVGVASKPLLRKPKLLRRYLKRGGVLPVRKTQRGRARR